MAQFSGMNFWILAYLIIFLLHLVANIHWKSYVPSSWRYKAVCACLFVVLLVIAFFSIKEVLSTPARYPFDYAALSGLFLGLLHLVLSQQQDLKNNSEQHEILKHLREINEVLQVLSKKHEKTSLNTSPSKKVLNRRKRSNAKFPDQPETIKKR